jgi:hypothetical protein
MTRSKLSGTYKKEREEICNKIIELVGTEFVLSDLDDNLELQQKIRNLKDDIQKYYAVSSLAVYRPNYPDVKRDYLILIRFIFREHGYNFMKTIAMQRPSIVQMPTPIYAQPIQVQEQALTQIQTPKPTPVEVKQPKKHFNIKEYLNSRNPITIDEFYDNYKPTIEEYDNICKLGITNGIIINFANYAKTYGDRCPIVVSNVQYERLHVHVFKKTEDEESEEKWAEYERIDAQLYMKDNIVIRFVNKYQKYISVFNEKYIDCLENPSNIADNNSHMEKKLGLTKAINTADQVSDKISRELAYKLAINRVEQ